MAKELRPGLKMPFHFGILSAINGEPLPAGLDVKAHLKAGVGNKVPDYNSAVVKSFEVYYVSETNEYVCQMTTELAADIPAGTYYADAVVVDANGDPSQTETIKVVIGGGITEYSA